ncbi:acetamidase/formamidase family protein [Salinicoccus albus]|uniref:acetamidase/formamidase family protein n=1 Tax=Salinicoccus albus TaxID=418756 RepID=UPI000368FACE|nr:acetamidase/formamidase family protein [Salinicoccus albus]
MTRGEAKQTVYVDQFTNGILDPDEAMHYHVKDGGHIVANTAPGCWGPMITPELKGGHEVTRPVFVEGAEPGDAIAVHIHSIRVTSTATASGNDEPVEGRFNGDPFIAGICPNCGAKNPKTRVEGIGQGAVRCAECGEDVTPFKFTNAYTMAFNESKTMGLTLNKENAEIIAREGNEKMRKPENSIQNPVVTFAPHDIPGVMARTIPFLGQLGTTPSRAFPDSHNAGDFAQFLIDAPHEYSMTESQIEDRTDGHMDINWVREGVTVICPVKVAGGGVYLGDMHAMQGNGEIAGHTTDVAGIVDLQVDVIKDLSLDGPMVMPLTDDLPPLAKPFTEREKSQAWQLADTLNMSMLEESYPISFIGTGADLNEATDNGMERAATLFGVTVPEIMNRATITGSIDIGRNPGVVTVTFLSPKAYMEKAKLLALVKNMYE